MAATPTDPRTPDAFAQLPRFLIADDGERDSVIHCHYPRFIMEFDANGPGKPHWIDAPIYDPARGETEAFDRNAAFLLQHLGFLPLPLAEEPREMFFGGHYATETFGVKALAAHLAHKFAVQWVFLGHPSGL